MKNIDAIVESIAEKFRCFGGGVVGSPNNPISHWTKDEPLQFALGVDVREVVEYVLKQAESSGEGESE